VTLLCEDDHIVLELKDDGDGFEFSENLIDYSTKGHFGLVGMKERADAIGAEFQVCSTPGNGTNIKVIVPVNNQ
jgi:signal transduction histidine kinase